MARAFSDNESESPMTGGLRDIPVKCKLTDEEIQEGGKWVGSLRPAQFNKTDSEWENFLNTNKFFERPAWYLIQYNHDPTYALDSPENDLFMYASLLWLAKAFDKLSVEQTQKQIHAFQKQNPNIEKDWQLYDRKKGFYVRYNSKRTTVYVDIIWKISWLKAMGLPVKKKLYFWRKQYPIDEEDGMIWEARQMVDRLNLCYIACRKTIEGMPDWLPLDTIPILVWTGPTEHTPEGTLWRGSPQWKYVVVEKAKDKEKDKTKEKDATTTYGSMTDPKTNNRRSVRLTRAHNQSTSSK